MILDFNSERMLVFIFIIILFSICKWNDHIIHNQLVQLGL